MANYTQKAILQTFEDMLREMPFDKITVSAIVARCEISPNTFYYHFRDIYDLLNTWMGIKELKYQELKQREDSWKDIIKMLFFDMQKNPDIVKHIFNSISRERLERYVFNSLEVAIYHMVRQKASGKDVPEDMQRTVAGICCYSLLGFLIKFIWNDLNTDVEKEVNLVTDFLDKSMRYYMFREISEEDGIQE